MNSTSIVPFYQVTLVTTLVSVNNILSLPLNGYVLWLILAGTSETLATDFFSLNLAMSELLFSLLSIFYFAYLFLGSFICLEAFMFSIGLIFTARPLFQCYICVECYVGVVHPVVFLRFKPLRYRVACCCVGWLTALVSCIFTKHIILNPLYFYVFFVQNLLFFALMLFCCLLVLRALKRPGPGDKNTGNKRSNTAKRRAFKMICLIMISMAINFSLYVAAIPLQCCLKSMEFTSALTICISLALIIGFIQPLLYLHRAQRFPCFREV